MKVRSLLLLFLTASIYLKAQTSSATFNHYRPKVHFAPARNWTNDPNGLIYYGGAYHLFFQYNPFGSHWGHMSWGHATSKDLIQWKENTVALPEYQNRKGDTVMIFSGTAVVDSAHTSGLSPKYEKAPLIALYTSNIINHGQLAQHQSLAYSFDGMVFHQYDRNPVLDIGSKEFRDPKVFWYAPTRRWIMIVAKPDRHRVQFYASPNLKQWTYLSDFGSVGDTSRVWECPDIFQLPATGHPGAYKWVITVSSGHPTTGYLGMQYFIGQFDGTHFYQDKDHYPRYVDYGKDYYAGITYNNLPAGDHRKIMIAWASSWAYAGEIPTTDYRGMMAIPRVLALKRDREHYVLVQQPVGELKAYLGKKRFHQEGRLPVTGKTFLSHLKDNAGMVTLTIDKSGGKAGIRILDNGDEHTLIYFDPTDNTLKLDRTHSGKVGFSEKFTSVESVPLGEGKKVQVTILIDRSLVEVFVDGGEKTLTDLVFPTHSGSDINLFSEGADGLFENISVQEIKPAIHS
jgi:fructan beta-fructosidase